MLDIERTIRQSDARMEKKPINSTRILHFSFFIYYNALPPHLNSLLSEDTRG